MKIWYVSPYASPEKYGWHSRPYIMSKFLANRGHKITIFAFKGSHYLRSSKRPKEKVEFINDVKFRWLPSIIILKQWILVRYLNWKMYNYFLKLIVSETSKEKPDVVIFSIPSLHHVSLIPWFKIKFPNSKVVFEIQDIWPLSVEQLSERLPFNWFWKQMKIEEETAMNLADSIIAVQPKIVDYVRKYFPKIQTKKVFFLPHAIPLSEIAESQDTIRVYDICYAGTISRANDLQTLIKALHLFKAKNNFELRVVLMGAGKNLNAIKKMAKGLKNVLFTGWLPRTDCLELIRQSSICFDGFLDLYLYEYGFSRLKWVDYMAKGKPILVTYSGSPID
ncbi:MAG: glycosyltransferase family 4 protein, partial [Bacteroidia bacterium]